jgi:endogenous inhibitor of DNA gyrase (YacG/DUF329 family)
MAETRLCVCCRRHQVEPPWRPFCSERCKLQDLARWADGSYRMPAEPDDEDEGQSQKEESQSDD